MIAVLGAGLTGLSAAYHLQDSGEVRVFEKESRPGGLCRSVTSEGFTFDMTGHLLHLRRPEIRALVESLLPEDRLVRIARRSFIHTHGRLTPYPFQVNLHGLPPEVVAECLTGFVEAMHANGDAGKVPGDEPSFRAWVLRTFGAGIARHFMFPYNEKLWLTDLEEVTSDWVSWSIPRPTLVEVVEGALGISRKAFGYNPSFLYPRSGGIACLPEALAAQVRHLRCGVEAVRIDATHRRLTLDTGETLAWDRLISTIPLPRLLACTEGIAPEIAAAARRLRHVAVININLGIDRVVQPDKHWIYFPDPEVVYYRAGFPASFTPEAAPPGCSSIYLEIAVRPDAPVDLEALSARAWQSLCDTGIVRASDRILTRVPIRIDPAYVIYDRARRAWLPRILAALNERGIHSVGRYGSWYYNSMEDSLAEGRDLARAMLADQRGGVGTGGGD